MPRNRLVFGGLTDWSLLGTNLIPSQIESAGGRRRRGPAEALKELRSACPETPLAQRVAALVMLARRQNGLDASQR
jgi:hypothetical protein